MEGGIARSPGFCMTMGTAATMTALAEALGMTLPGASSIPAAGFESRAHGDGLRRTDCRDDLGRCPARGSLTMNAFRECDHRGHGDRRFHECADSSGCYGGPVRAGS